jgi:hypothetical protein
MSRRSGEAAQADYCVAARTGFAPLFDVMNLAMSAFSFACAEGRMYIMWPAS